ncbi:EGFR adapter protein [Anopheles gambiae]|uniref:SH2 domain-containing protein n=1 Tax=Anopheles melas TaxID=34690 RepID=A0A182TIY8_9DIPT|nr:EGFR adapter protein-like [Anopheles coluzzii]XP_061499166.1 EGFR adapter protein [Anopheles gambiae]XP_061499167.1 EGFR adapter protein [Anopheles gambiae]XP_061499168.1 EGFR adapter protein [Anopheles gambiae]XP_061499169.1 EGFR adapter protein [Anopheles gambiae]
MNCTAINSNQIETTPNNLPRLMGGMGTATPLSTSHTPTSRTAKATICSGPGGTGGSVGTTVFFHRTTNNLLDVPRTANSSEEENSPTELNTCRKLTEKPPLVKRLTMGILRTAEDSRPLVHSSSSPSSSSSSSQTISDGYVNEGICADTAETTLSTTVFTTCSSNSNKLSGSATSATITTTPTMAAGSSTIRSPLTPGTSLGAAGTSILFDAGGPRYNHTATTLLYPPAVPLRNDSLSLKEQHELKGAPWFQAGIPREISLEVLSRQNPGAFLVRQSTTKPGCFALSLRVPPPAPKVAHYLILRTIRGYKIKGFTKEFTSLRALITHHSVMPELLPVPLALPRPPQIVHRQEDPETYGSLNDFQNMITE